MGCYGRLFLFVLFLVGSSSMALPKEAEDAKREVVFWNLFTTGESHRVVTDLVQRFNEENQTHCVKQVDIPYGHIHSKILPAVAGNVPPDVSILDRFQVASYAARGAFLDLDEWAERDGIFEGDFFQAPWLECLYNDRLYAVPYDTDVRILYYNKALFREAGLDPDKPPKTWKELEEYSEVLTERRRDGRLDQVGYVPIWGNTGLYLYGWQKGGRFLSEDGRTVTLNHPRNVEALEWILKVVDDYGISGLLSLQTGFGADAQNPFITGKIAMIVLDVGELSMIQKYGQDLEWGVAPCPHPDDGIPATWSGGFSLVLPRGSRNVEGAWAWCLFVLREESQRYMAISSNKLPALKSAAQDPFFQSSPFWRLAIEQMATSHYRPVTPVGQAINTEMWNAMDQVVHHKLEPQEALDRATTESQNILDEFLERTKDAPLRWRPVSLAMAALLLVLAAFRGIHTWKRIRRMRLRRKEAIAGYAFALPSILGLFLFVLGPVIATLLFSFTRYDIISSPQWVGGQNYNRLFTEDRYFLTCLWNTFFYAALSVPLGTLLSLGLAMLLNQPIRGRSIYRTLFYLPTVVPVVAGSLLWAWLFNEEYGLINVVLGGLGLPAAPWLTSEDWSKPALIIMGFWHVGGGMIIFLAALQGVPRSLYEAARIDGAGFSHSFRHVTLPMISPAMFFMLVMGVIGALQVFAQAYLMTNGGPVNSTLFYVLYLYRQAFQDLRMGYASSMAWVLFLVILALTGIQFALSKRWVYYEGAKR